MTNSTISYNQAAHKLHTTINKVKELVENDLLVGDQPGFVTIESFNIYDMYHALAPDSLLQKHMRALKKIAELRNANMLYQSQNIEPVDLEFLLTPVWTTQLPNRLLDILQRANIRYVFQLLIIGAQNISKYQGYGKKSHMALEEFFKEHDIDFNDPHISHDIIHQCVETVASKTFQSIKHKRVI